jgi:dipeptidyl-peptidase-4
MFRFTRIFILVGALLTNHFSWAQLEKKSITLEDIWANPIFRPEFVSGLRSMNDGLHYTSIVEIDKIQAVAKFSYTTGKQENILFSEKDLKDASGNPIQMHDYIFSSDEKLVMISANSEKIYRYSTKEDYYIFNLETRKLSPLSKNGKQRLADFSPNGAYVSFVRDNNLFLVELSSMKETQITYDGEWNKIINGGIDWVYEEEFTLKTGIQWSPDSRRIAFYRFDESQVKEFAMTMYNTGLYPEPYSYKYPKAGEKNSIVNLSVHAISEGKTIAIDVGSETDQYIPCMQWTTSPTVLSFQRLNRLQNKLELLLADVMTGKSNVILTETSKQYVDVHDNLYFLKNGKQFIWSSDRDGNNHLYVHDIDAAKQPIQLTKGAYDVTELYGLNETTGLLFYQSNEENSIQRDNYSIAIDGKKKKKLSALSGTNRAEFSSGMNYFINTWSNANTPPVVTLHASNGTMIKQLVDNTELKQKTMQYGFTKKDFLDIPSTDGIVLKAWMMKPVDFDPSKKYPVLMHVYGGPGHNTVSDEWGIGDFYWQQMLTQLGYIVVSVDNRGTQYRGSDFLKSTYGRMGELESTDQIAAAKWLRQLSYVDAKRIGIQGWSYGGYLSSLCLAVGADVFKMAISIAPVGNWRFYDSIYTERFMGLPKDNAKGYDAFSPTTHLQNIKGKLLLVHGTADDNVHFQNSVEMVNTLIKANVQFDFFMFPDKSHSIRGGNARLYLFTKMTDFVKANL